MICLKNIKYFNFASVTQKLITKTPRIMQLNYFFLTLLCLLTFISNAQLVSEDFGYADGSLTTNAAWDTHSGTAGQVQVSSGTISLEMGPQSEDVNTAFATVTSGLIFAEFDLIVNDDTDISGTDHEYFFHFNSSGFKARVDAVPALGTENYSLGLSSNGGSAAVVWPNGLTYGQTYNVIVRYSIDDNISKLWVDPISNFSNSIIDNTSSGSGADVDAVSFRESNSNNDETITIDNLTVSDVAADVFDMVLPVELVSFLAKKSKNTINLKWQTASEINNDRFEIQRSYDANRFESIGRVDGESSSHRLVDYSFLDNAPLSGINYYRLKQVDIDGAFAYSDVVSVKMDNTNIHITPTSTYDFVTVSTGSQSSIILRSVNGQVMDQQSNSKGNFTVEMAHYPQGIYFLTINKNGSIQTEKVVRL
jgi:hypothetical protein